MALSAWGRPRFPGPAARRPLPARLGRRDPLPRVPACGVLQSRPAAAPLWSQTPVRASHLTCPNPRPLRSPSPRPSSPPRPSGPRPPPRYALRARDPRPPQLSFAQSWNRPLRGPFQAAFSGNQDWPPVPAGPGAREPFLSTNLPGLQHSSALRWGLHLSLALTASPDQLLFHSC